MKIWLFISCITIAMSASAQIESDRVDSISQAKEAKEKLKDSKSEQQDEVGAIGAREEMAPDTTVYVLTHRIAAEASGCWATFFDEEYFGGASLTLAGDRDLVDVDLDLKPYKFGGSPDSVKVGPNARLQLYGDEFFTDIEHELQANEFVANLTTEPFWDRIESVRLICTDAVSNE